MKRFSIQAFVIFLLVLLAYSPLNAQTEIQKNSLGVLSGNVIDSKTQNPIPHAEIFISGTTAGCISDIEGNFTLKIPFYPCTVVADHVAYESFIMPLEKPIENFKITLSPSNFSVGEINVSAKNKRKRNLRFFYSHFIKEEGNKIKILNDTVLIFNRTEMDFTASTKEPLIIVNNYLGYKIKAIIKNFHVCAVDGPNGEKLPLDSKEGGEIMKLSGYYYYEPIVNKTIDKLNTFNINRRQEYYGSYRHFMKSIYDENPGKNGYQVNFFPNTPDSSAIMLYEKKINNRVVSELKNCRLTGDSIKVYYFFDDDKMPIDIQYIEDRYYYRVKKSIIYPSEDGYQIRPNGTSPNVNFVVHGSMSPKSFTNSLPDDYLPPVK